MADIYRCCHTRKCKWSGEEADLISIHNEKKSKEFGVKVTDQCCPECKNSEFYVDKKQS